MNADAEQSLPGVSRFEANLLRILRFALRRFDGGWRIVGIQNK